MAIEKEINLNVNSNIEGSIGQLKALKRELKGVDVGTEEFKKLYNQIDDLEDKIKSAKNKSSDWIDSLASAGGPVGLLGESLNKLKVSTQSFGGALKATGIGLVVGLVASLAAAFNDNEKAQKKLQPLLNGLEKIFNGIFTVVEPLFNTLVDLAVSALPMVSDAFGVVYASVSAVFQSLGALASAIGKLIKGDFSGAWKDAKSSVNDFSDNYDKANKRFQDGSKELTKTEKEELAKRREEEKKHQEELLNKQKDANAKAAEERKRVAEEKRKAEEDRRNTEQNLEKKYLDELLNLNAKSDQEKLDLQKQRDLDEINNLNTTANEKSNLLALFNEKYATLQTELDDKQKAEADKKQADRDALNKAAADKKAQEDIDREKLVANSKIEIQMQALDALNGLIGLAKGFGEKSKDIQRAALIAESAVGIAKIIINTNQANLQALANPANEASFGAYGATKIALNWVTAGISMASTVAATAKGLSALGGGGSAPSAPSGTTSAPAAPSFNVVGNSGVNQVANVLNNQGMPPIKTYVTAGEVTTQQGLNRNIVSNATLG